MSDSVPFVSLSAGTETGAETEDRVIGDSIPFVSLSVGTEAGTGTEEPTPQSPTIPIPDPIPIAPQAPPIPISTPTPISIPNPIPNPIAPSGAPVPASGVPSHLFSYELGQPLQSPCPCF